MSINCAIFMLETSNCRDMFICTKDVHMNDFDNIPSFLFGSHIFSFSDLYQKLLKYFFLNIEIVYTCASSYGCVLE